MKKSALITGANRGIGFQIAKILHSQNYNVTAICRSKNTDLDSICFQVISNIDLRENDQISIAKKKCLSSSFDLVINNAGVLNNETIHNLSNQASDQIKDQFLINSLAPLIVTYQFLDTLKNGSKVIFITSRMGSIADNDSGGRYGYRMSKAALNAAGKSLSIDLKSKGIAVGIFHPGWVQTDMTGYSGHLTATESAQFLCQRIDALNMDNSGAFFHSNGENLPW